MHDFHCKAPEEMYNPVLRRQVYQFKKTRGRSDVYVQKRWTRFTGMEKLERE